MKNPFERLETFLRLTRGEVDGRGVQRIPANVRQRVRAFAAGRASAAERAQLAEVLNKNPDWIEWLVRRVVEERPRDAEESAQPPGEEPDGGSMA